MDTIPSTTMKLRGKAPPAASRIVIYCVAFVIGAIVMSFEMLGSRYLNPYFGNGIYTWAALISTVLAALATGYFLGGFIADRSVSAAVLGMIVGVGSVYLLALPNFADTMLHFVFDTIDNARLGSLYGALAIMFLPVSSAFPSPADAGVLRAGQGASCVWGIAAGSVTKV